LESSRQASYHLRVAHRSLERTLVVPRRAELSRRVLSFWSRALWSLFEACFSDVKVWKVWSSMLPGGLVGLGFRVMVRSSGVFWLLPHQLDPFVKILVFRVIQAGRHWRYRLCNLSNCSTTSCPRDSLIG